MVSAQPWEIAGSTPDSGTIMLYEHADFGTYRSSVPGHIDQIRLGEDAEASIQTVANHQAEVLELFVAKSLLEIEEGAIVEEGGVVESDSFRSTILRTAEGTYIAEQVSTLCNWFAKTPENPFSPMPRIQNSAEFSKAASRASRRWPTKGPGHPGFRAVWRTLAPIHTPHRPRTPRGSELDTVGIPFLKPGPKGSN